MAEMLTVYRRNGQVVEHPAPTGDEDRDDYLDEQFLIGVQVTTWCSEDGVAVYPSTVRPALERFCELGHCWQWLGGDFDNYSQSQPGAGWRQVR